MRHRLPAIIVLGLLVAAAPGQYSVAPPNPYALPGGVVPGIPSPGHYIVLNRNRMGTHVPGVPFPVQEYSMNRMRITTLQPDPQFPVIEQYQNRMRITTVNPEVPLPGQGIAPSFTPPTMYVPGRPPAIRSGVPGIRVGANQRRNTTPAVRERTVSTAALAGNEVLVRGVSEENLQAKNWSAGRSFADNQGRQWNLVAGKPEMEQPDEMSGWVMRSEEGIPHFYTQTGRIFRMQTSR